MMILLTLFTALAAAQTPPPAFDPVQADTWSQACIAGAQDPAASYTVADDTQTLYTGSDLGTFITEGTEQLVLDHSVMSVTLDTEANTAFANYQKCMNTHGLVTGLFIWSNTAGGEAYAPHDAKVDGETFAFADAFWMGGQFVLQHSPTSGNPTCDNLYLKGEVFGGNTYYTTAKTYRPATPADKDFELWTCEYIGPGYCEECELEYMEHLSQPYFCLCKATQAGSCNAVKKDTKPAFGALPTEYILDGYDPTGGGVVNENIWGNGLNSI